MQGNRPEELYRRKAQFVIGKDLRDYTQRFAATRSWRFRRQKLSATTELDTKHKAACNH
jgi:hypothetical protein